MSDAPGGTPKPRPVEVVIVATTEPVPVTLAGSDAILTPTGRPDPLPPDPTPAQLAEERAQLHKANNGRFRVEDPRPPIEVPRPAEPMRDLSLFFFLHLCEVAALLAILAFAVMNYLALHPAAR